MRRLSKTTFRRPAVVLAPRSPGQFSIAGFDGVSRENASLPVFPAARYESFARDILYSKISTIRDLKPLFPKTCANSLFYLA